MRVEPLNFKEFQSEGAIARAAHRSNLPGGRRKEEAPPPPPAPTFSEDQLKAAERESYKKGFLEGTEEGRKQAESEQAQTDLALLAAAENFVQTISPLFEDYRKMALQLRQDLPQVALTIARKVAGSALEQNAQAAVEDIALACVQTMIGEPKLAITVHPSLAETLERKLKALSERLHNAAHIVVSKDGAMAPSDCRVEWKYGAMERHTGALWEHIERAVANMRADAERITNVQMEPLQAALPAGNETNQKE